MSKIISLKQKVLQQIINEVNDVMNYKIKDVEIFKNPKKYKVSTKNVGNNYDFCHNLLQFKLNINKMQSHDTVNTLREYSIEFKLHIYIIEENIKNKEELVYMVIEKVLSTLKRLEHNFENNMSNKNILVENIDIIYHEPTKSPPVNQSLTTTTLENCEATKDSSITISWLSNIDLTDSIYY